MDHFENFSDLNAPKAQVSIWIDSKHTWKKNHNIKLQH